MRLTDPARIGLYSSPASAEAGATVFRPYCSTVDRILRGVLESTYWAAGSSVPKEAVELRHLTKAEGHMWASQNFNERTNHGRLQPAEVHLF
jgi:hypothetical protein